ncbi:MAG: YggS family pyridoxal phosphate enzyme [Solirubrobacteraceae bacterium]
MVDLITSLSAQDVARNLASVRTSLAQAGVDPDGLEILAAVKYLPAELLPALADGGITLAGENRGQDLVVKAQTPAGRRLHWDFIGTLQSRKVRAILPYVRYIHSVATDSALAALGRYGGPDTSILVEVNVAGDPGKTGVAPSHLAEFIKSSPVKVAGLMTMPPLTDDPERNRIYFRRLRELAADHGLSELSMGTSQDFVVAAQEGATIIRLGSVLFAPTGS